jgi:hypothetical protein
VTAQEIRKTEICADWTLAEENIGDSIFQMLREIAAQLAELNKRLEAGSDGFNVNAIIEPRASDQPPIPCLPMTRIR